MLKKLILTALCCVFASQAMAQEYKVEKIQTSTEFRFFESEQTPWRLRIRGAKVELKKVLFSDENNNVAFQATSKASKQEIKLVWEMSFGI